MRLGGEPGLAPLEPQEGDEVRASRIPGQGVALPHALLGGVPVRGEQGLSVVGEREEVEIGTVAGEVAGVRRRVGALAAYEGEREEKGDAPPSRGWRCIPAGLRWSEKQPGCFCLWAGGDDQT